MILRMKTAQIAPDWVLFTSLMEMDSHFFTTPMHLNFRPWAKTAVIVYDIIPFLFSEYYLKTEALKTRYERYLNIVVSADLLLAISECTRNDLITYLDVPAEKIVTIGTGVDVRGFPTVSVSETQQLSAIDLDTPFLLYLGGDEYRKNLPGMVRGFAYYRRSYEANLRLYVLGKITQSDEDLKALIVEAGLAPEDIIFLGNVEDATLKALYTKCALVVVPSLYEGFGLPVIEARLMGAKVVVSRNSALMENMDDDLAMFDPLRPDDMARAMHYALTHPAPKKALDIDQRYNWAEVAQRALAAMRHYEEMVSVSPPSEGCARVSVMVAGDIDDFVMKALSSLVRQYDVTLYLPNDRLEAARALPYRLETIDALGAEMSERTPILVICETDGVELDGLMEAFPDATVVSPALYTCLRRQNWIEARPDGRIGMEHLALLQGMLIRQLAASPLKFVSDLRVSSLARHSEIASDALARVVRLTCCEPVVSGFEPR